MPNCSNASSRIVSVRPVVRRSSGYLICRVFAYLLQRPPSIGGAVKKLVVIIISHFGAYFFYYFPKFLNNAQFCTLLYHISKPGWKHRIVITMLQY